MLTHNPEFRASQGLRRAAPNRPLNAAEAEEFARVLGVSPDAIRSPNLTAAEAYQTLANYDQLVEDPVKSRFAASNSFFTRVKATVARQLTGDLIPQTSIDQLRVLDVGCGTGELMRTLGAYFDEAWGCDPSLSMVRRSGEKALRMPRPTEIPYECNSFDVLICACVYHHIALDLREAHIREMYRVTKPGGLVMIFEHNPRNPVTRMIVDRCPIDRSAILLSDRATERLLGGAGFNAVRSHHYLFFPERLYRLFGNLERWLNWTGMGGQYCTVGKK